MSRLKKKYTSEAIPALMKLFKYKNVMQVPRLEKVSINIGLGEAITNAKALEAAKSDLMAISGQFAITTRSRKSISAFRLREGMPIGLKVTLRGDRMYEFLDRLVALALPRVRDFRGLDPNAFDGHGNYNLGITEQVVFPEINPDKFTTMQGMNVTMVTSTDSNDEARELLKGFGVPLRAA